MYEAFSLMVRWRIGRLVMKSLSSIWLMPEMMAKKLNVKMQVCLVWMPLPPTTSSEVSVGGVPAVLEGAEKYRHYQYAVF